MRDTKMTDKELMDAINALLETGELVIAGYNDSGEAMYCLREYAEANGIKPITN